MIFWQHRTSKRRPRRKSKGWSKQSVTRISEALRKMIEEHLQEHPELFAGEEVGNLLREADNISDAQLDREAAEI